MLPLIKPSSKEAFLNIKNNAIIANAGHFNVEIDITSLEKLSIGKEIVKENITSYRLEKNKVLYLLSEGRLLNLSAAEGHPASVMDMSFANQILSIEYLLKENKKLANKVYSVPSHIDEKIALLKLKSMNIEIDQLTPEQKKYLNSWEEGT